MIELHRLTHPDEPFLLNPDLIVTVEATPDTVITLQNGSRLLVDETPAEVSGRIRHWHAGILAEASLGRVIDIPSG
jgi:flagellar protein FlbD